MTTQLCFFHVCTDRRGPDGRMERGWPLSEQLASVAEAKTKLAELLPTYPGAYIREFREWIPDPADTETTMR